MGPSLPCRPLRLQHTVTSAVAALQEVEQLRWELEEAQDELARLQQAIGFRDLFSAAGGALRPLAST